MRTKPTIMKNALFFSLFFFSLFSSSFVQSQDNTRLKAEIYSGINSVATYSGYAVEISPNSFSKSNVTSALSGFKIGSAIRYQLSNRFSTMLDLSYTNAKKTTTNFHAFTDTDISLLSLESTREYTGIGADILILFSLTQFNKVVLQIGTGVSLLHRKHYYRSLLEIGLNGQGETVIIVEDYTNEVKNQIGLPLFISFDYMLTEKLSLGLRSKLTAPFSNSDLIQSAAISFGFHF